MPNYYIIYSKYMELSKNPIFMEIVSFLIKKFIQNIQNLYLRKDDQLNYWQHWK